MLIEVWERLRGYDKWVQTEAKIKTSKVKRTSHSGRDGGVSYTWASSDTIEWVDGKGQKQSSHFNVDDGSPLYQFVGGETVTIRYNPIAPSHFYYRDLLKSKVHHAFRLALISVLFCGFLGLIALFGFAFGGRR